MRRFKLAALALIVLVIAGFTAGAPAEAATGKFNVGQTVVVGTVKQKVVRITVDHHYAKTDRGLVLQDFAPTFALKSYLITGTTTRVYVYTPPKMTTNAADGPDIMASLGGGWK